MGILVFDGAAESGGALSISMSANIQDGGQGVYAGLIVSICLETKS